jgi:hypothetical protein
MNEIDLSQVHGGMRDGHTCVTALVGGAVGLGLPAGLAQKAHVPSEFKNRGGLTGALIGGIAGAAAVYYGTDACE